MDTDLLSKPLSNSLRELATVISMIDKLEGWVK